MKIYRMITDYERCLSLKVRIIRDDLANAMLRGESLAQSWEPLEAMQRPGCEIDDCDFVKMPWTCAQFGINSRTRELLQPHLGEGCELLPMTYNGVTYWVLYIRDTCDCLDTKRTIYHGEEKDPRKVLVAAFIPDKLPNRPLMRIHCDINYYVTEELKELIERAGLVGVRFQFMWSDDGSEPESLEEAPRRKKIKRKRGKRSADPSDPRARLLQRLWQEVILPRGSADDLDRNLTISRVLGGGNRYDSARAIRRLIKQGASKDDLLDLAASLAYEVTFETLVAIEEECLDKSSALESLHEELLTAEPD